MDVKSIFRQFIRLQVFIYQRRWMPQSRPG